MYETTVLYIRMINSVTGNPSPAVIHRATDDQALRAARILADSFHDDPIWTWTFPDRPGRTAILPRFFSTYVRSASTNGSVLIAEPDLGAALWIRVDGPDDTGTAGDRDAPDDTTGTSDDAGEDEELPSIYEPYLERLTTLGGLLEQAHPSDPPHLYLPLIAVREEARGTGLGSALLARGLGESPDGHPALPAYLEASSERNRALYERHGFRAFGDPIRLPDGPTLHPMWREPDHPSDPEQNAGGTP